MAPVELSPTAVEDLDRMIVTHSLPADTRARAKRSLRILEMFPLVGRQLGTPWQDFRFILGPWRWFVILYTLQEHENRVCVLVLDMHDARSSTSVTSIAASR